MSGIYLCWLRTFCIWFKIVFIRNYLCSEKLHSNRERRHSNREKLFIVDCNLFIKSSSHSKSILMILFHSNDTPKFMWEIASSVFQSNKCAFINMHWTVQMHTTHKITIQMHCNGNETIQKTMRVLQKVFPPEKI